MKKAFTAVAGYDRQQICFKIEEMVNNPPYWELINITSTSIVEKATGTVITTHYAFFQRDIKD